MTFPSECPQRNILKIRDKIPGHGPQEAKCLYRPLHNGSIHIMLACGCSVPIWWLPLEEQHTILRNVRKLTGNRGV